MNKHPFLVMITQCKVYILEKFLKIVEKEEKT